MELLTALALAATLGVPGHANANVSMAADGRMVAIVWSASTEQGATDIYAAFSRDAGATFATPTRVNSIPGDARVNGEQPPRVSLVPTSGAAPAIVVVWTAKGAAGTALLTARSIDGGRTFGRAAAVPGTDGAGSRGWEAIATGAHGSVNAIWLDHRELAAAAPMDMSHHTDHDAPAPAKADGVARAQLSKLYFASLGNPGSVKAITGGVCYCCKTAIATGADGSIYAVWRHVYPGNLRDIAFTLSRDGGRTFATPIRVSEDKWMIDGCPENGPTIAVDRRNRIHVAWPTLVGGPAGGETLRLFYASSPDGRQFMARQPIPTEGVPRHPQMVVAGDGALLLAWDEEAGPSRRLAIARGTARPDGSIQFRREVAGGDRPGVYPALAATSDGVLVAWASGPAASSMIRLMKVR